MEFAVPLIDAYVASSGRSRDQSAFFPCLTWPADKFRLRCMLAAETRMVGASIAAVPLEESFGWTRIVEVVEPFLQSVGKRLAAQTDEFEPHIAAYARYALIDQR